MENIVKNRKKRLQGFFATNFDYDGTDFQDRVRAQRDKSDDQCVADMYCFENELGNQINIAVEEVEDSKGEKKFDAVEIYISGPDSEVTNTITYYEAITLNKLLTDFLNSSNKSKSKISMASKLSKGKKWSLKYKRKINCNNPKGFSQKQYCKRKRKNKK